MSDGNYFEPEGGFIVPMSVKFVSRDDSRGEGSSETFVDEQGFRWIRNGSTTNGLRVFSNSMNKLVLVNESNEVVDSLLAGI